MLGLIATVIGNAITIICCTIFSMHFNNPWLILVALLFYRNYSYKEGDNDVDKNAGVS